MAKLCVPPLPPPTWKSDVGSATHFQTSWNINTTSPLQTPLKCCAQNYNHPHDDSNQSIGKIAVDRIANKLRSLSFSHQVISEDEVSQTDEFLHGSNAVSEPEVSEPEGVVILDKNKRAEYVPTLAQLAIPLEERRRLRTIGLYSGRTIRIGKAGITQPVVDAIRNRWTKSEVARIKCGALYAINIKKTHDLLEKKTGGLVVWKARDIVILYRGIDYRNPNVSNSTISGVNLESASNAQYVSNTSFINTSVTGVDGNMHMETSGELKQVNMAIDVTVRDSLIKSDIEVKKKDSIYLLGERQSERKFDSLLDGTDPRFIGGWRYGLPLDSDLLPTAANRYIRPCWLLPSGIKDDLNEFKMSSLQKPTDPILPEFSLGIIYQLQGLATAIVKIWEQNEIAKISVKPGNQSNYSEENTEPRWHTGGCLLSKNNESTILYTGKDFISFDAARLLAERKATKFFLQKARKTHLKKFSTNHAEKDSQFSSFGSETRSSQCKEQWEKKAQSEDLKKTKEETSKDKREAVAKSLDSKLTYALSKKVELENELDAIERALKCRKPPANQGTITIEERLTLRKIGLKMNSFILLGRPGAYDSVIENIHLHWKYRKLAKIITKERSFAQVKDLARSLEFESGGILVAVDSVEKGHAIIMYRGNNYQCPTMLRTDSLLNRKAASRRWNAIQRRESIRLELLRVDRDVDRLKFHFSKVQDVKEEITLQLTEEINSSYLFENKEEDTLQFTEELDSEYLSDFVEESKHQDAYLAPYDNGNNNEDKYSLCQEVKQVTKLGKAKITIAEHNYKRGKLYKEIYLAEPLSNRDKRLLRDQAKNMPKAAHFCVGKKNVVVDLAKSIRSRFKKYAFVKVDVRGRAKGTSIAEIAFQLEEATGSLVVHRQPGKVVLYRGWPEGQDKPS